MISSRKLRLLSSFFTSSDIGAKLRESAFVPYSCACPNFNFAKFSVTEKTHLFLFFSLASALRMLVYLADEQERGVRVPGYFNPLGPHLSSSVRDRKVILERAFNLCI
jgi:hypothetical protein